jgi:Tfp pilus assembly protein FimT
VSAKQKTTYGERGDTIVEVLIAMAVAASVLGISYGAMNRNMLIIRDNQERTEASKILQGQIELLRSLALTTPLSVPAPNTSFCMLSNGTPKLFSDSTYPRANLTADDFSKYPTPECVNGFFNLAITTTDGINYHFYARWEKVYGGGRDEVQMVYRK